MFIYFGVGAHTNKEDNFYYIGLEKPQHCIYIISSLEQQQNLKDLCVTVDSKIVLAIFERLQHSQ